MIPKQLLFISVIFYCVLQAAPASAQFAPPPPCATNSDCLFINNVPGVPSFFLSSGVDPTANEVLVSLAPFLFPQFAGHYVDIVGPGEQLSDRLIFGLNGEVALLSDNEQGVLPPSPFGPVVGPPMLVFSEGPAYMDIGVPLGLGPNVLMVYSDVEAIPEPETYAMLLAGLGLLGFTARRRKQKAA